VDVARILCVLICILRKSLLLAGQCEYNLYSHWSARRSDLRKMFTNVFTDRLTTDAARLQLAHGMSQKWLKSVYAEVIAKLIPCISNFLDHSVYDEGWAVWRASGTSSHCSIHKIEQLQQQHSVYCSTAVDAEWSNVRCLQVTVSYAHLLHVELH